MASAAAIQRPLALARPAIFPNFEVIEVSLYGLVVAGWDLLGEHCLARSLADIAQGLAVGFEGLPGSGDTTSLPLQEHCAGSQGGA
jgi:hypothetical protein